MQLTPKDIYEAARPHLVKHGMEDVEWEDFTPEAWNFYIDLAARLNTQFITPLQGLMDKLHGEFKALRDMDRKIFDEQDEQIAALKALVKDLVEGLQDCWDNEYSLEELNGLKARAQALLAAKEH